MAALLAAMCLAAGCAETASVRTSHPPLGRSRWSAARVAYNYSAGRIIEVAIEGRWMRDDGSFDHDFLHLTVPEKAGTYEVGPDGLRAERVVRLGQEEFLYRATGGWATYSFSTLSGDHVDVEFSLKMELVYPKELAGSSWPVQGTARAPESVLTAQGLVNKYSPVVKRLTAEAAAKSDAPAKP
jgi:hypothetical protein